MQFEDIDDDSDSIFSEDPLDNIEGDEEQTNEASDKEYFVLNKNDLTRPGAKPYWVKKFDPNKHVMYEPDWPIVGSNVRSINNIQIVKPAKDLAKEKAIKERIAILCRNREVLRKQNKSIKDINLQIAKEYEKLENL